ncbi:hypothetical protein OPQ81_004178 [Rhizoctonia solani]|nr:hypothetical protein OPQ81_004178 [Rhizoctonia solani]
MPWQKTITLARRSKGCHLVTDEILSQISEGLRQTPTGILHLFIQHTSAALTVNENYDPVVLNDSLYDSDSVSHTKTSLIGPSLHIPITNNSLNLGTWQGIYLAEFRHAPHTRRVVCTILP